MGKLRDEIGETVIREVRFLSLMCFSFSVSLFFHSFFEASTMTLEISLSAKYKTHKQLRRRLDKGVTVIPTAEKQLDDSALHSTGESRKIKAQHFGESCGCARRPQQEKRGPVIICRPILSGSTERKGVCVVSL